MKKIQSYDYKNRKGLKEINWNEFHLLCKKLAGQLKHKKIDLIIGIAKSGLFPSALLAGMLQKEIYPIRITRRHNDIVIRKELMWIVDLPKNIKNKNILIVDEMADSGETLLIVCKKAKQLGAKSILTVSLAAHTWAKPMPNYVGIKSNALIIFPWDTQILINKKWQLHPELKGAILELRKK